VAEVSLGVAIVSPGPISSASDDCSSTFSKNPVNGNAVFSIHHVIQTKASASSCLGTVGCRDISSDESCMSALKQIEAYVGDKYALEWSRNLEEMDNSSKACLSIIPASSETSSVEASDEETDEMEMGQLLQMEQMK
jgi:hypothetical protein